jgi:hypothetical protein
MRDDKFRLSEIRVEVCIIQNFMSDHNRVGCSGWLDDRHRPNRFYIDVDSNLSYDTALISLAHELVHIKQMAMGERAEGLDGMIRWFGRPYDVAQIHYYDLPWEIEAHGREYGLYDRFVQSIRNEELEPAKIIDVTQRLRVA